MIIGLGSDLCHIERIQKSLDRFGDRFINRVFTEAERARASISVGLRDPYAANNLEG